MENELYQVTINDRNKTNEGKKGNAGQGMDYTRRAQLLIVINLLGTSLN
ncbi:hypothetical protein MC7420_1630 [Coleofasciculus chthonoplastes PCC 7420]|uniref:Uncharacterized protein n=1 Tax=Coleofasciculus chthonoplastes PCC 7420 TaxID=118168 RepID=B4W317_9CYAN|nr:hypothetical protein MC7420_1630 [Coleofasciculus chthonoplastes PCC 7420]